MDISRSIKFYILLIPYSIAILFGVLYHIIIYLCLSLGAFILFIYRKLKWR